MKNILLVDHEFLGHHYEYVAHLLCWIENHSSDCIYHLAINSTILEKYEREFNCKICDQLNVKVHRIDPFSLGCFDFSKKYFTLLEKKLVEIIRSESITSVFLAHFNFFQIFLLKMRLLHLRVVWYGIYFFPYPRLEAKNFASRLRLFRKKFLIDFLFHFKCVEALFVLGDSYSVNFLNDRLGRSSSIVIPDPIWHNSKKVADSDLAIKVKEFAPGRYKFVFVGILAARKGLLSFLNSFQFLNRNNRLKLAFFFAGPFEEGFREPFLDAYFEAKERYPELILQLEEGFVPTSEIVQIFREGHAVIMPYIKTEGSSGIAGHAALAERPILGPISGYVGDLIAQYRLGVCVESSSPLCICEGILRIMNESFSVSDFQKYVEVNSPKLFAEKIMTIVAAD